MTMIDAVRNVLNDIDKNVVFDSHFIIAQIIKQHSDVYIHFAGPNGVETTAQMHHRIAQLIADTGLATRLTSELAPQLPYDSWSDTIHGTPGKCALWKLI